MAGRASFGSVSFTAPQAEPKEAIARPADEQASTVVKKAPTPAPPQKKNTSPPPPPRKEEAEGSEKKTDAKGEPPNDGKKKSARNGKKAKVKPSRVKTAVRFTVAERLRIRSLFFLEGSLENPLSAVEVCKRAGLSEKRAAAVSHYLHEVWYNAGSKRKKGEPIGTEEERRWEAAKAETEKAVAKAERLAAEKAAKQAKQTPPTPPVQTRVVYVQAPPQSSFTKTLLWAALGGLALAVALSLLF